MTPAAQPALVRAALAVLAVVLLWLLITPLYRMGFWLEQPNEGRNVTHALNAFGSNIYPAPSSFIVNNYPPLRFYLTGGLARLTSGAIPKFDNKYLDKGLWFSTCVPQDCLPTVSFPTVATDAVRKATKLIIASRQIGDHCSSDSPVEPRSASFLSGSHARSCRR